MKIETFFKIIMESNIKDLQLQEVFNKIEIYNNAKTSSKKATLG